MPDTFRTLCAELADALEQLHKQSVTAPHTQFVELSNGRHPIPLGTDVLTQDLMVNDLLDRARAALAEEAVGPPRPIPVATRLPGAEDCDAEGRCWLLPISGESGAWCWILDRPDAVSAWTHWLPFHALPLPQENTDD